jgi:hypothetical protein
MSQQRSIKIKSYFNQIHVLEGYIGKDLSNFLAHSFDSHLQPHPTDKGIFSGPSIFGVNNEKPSYIDKDLQYNIAVDMLTIIGQNIENTVSKFYNKPFLFKSFYYSVMKKGAENKLHMDNYYINENKELKIKENEYDDRAALLYLNDEYEGGMLNFPLQDLSLKPKPGTLIFFQGDHLVPHEVSEVESGSRVNIVSFLGNEVDKGKPTNRYINDSQILITRDIVFDKNIMRPYEPSEIV